MPGRNDPCHCGSGKKYKHCHLPREEALRAAERRGQANPIPPQVPRQLAAIERHVREHKERFGHAREPVHADFHGFKFVAVGGTLHYSDEWRNFTDFLLDYVKTTLGRAFGPDWYPRER